MRIIDSVVILTTTFYLYMNFILRKFLQIFILYSSLNINRKLIEASIKINEL